MRYVGEVGILMFLAIVAFVCVHQYLYREGPASTATFMIGMFILFTVSLASRGFKKR